MGKSSRAKLGFLFLLAIALAVGAVLGYSLKPAKYIVLSEQELDLSLFWEAWETLKEKFVEPSEIDSEKAVLGAISGMVGSLEDPYTVFLDETDTKRFLEDVSGQFEGVGMEIGIRKGQLQVVAPLKGTPADQAGLRSKDKILKVGDIFTADLTLDEVVNLIRGPKGSDVVLTILRDDWANSKEITITRDVIDVPSLEWEIIDDDIAYIELYHFTEIANTDFNKASVDILQSQATKIILDLRNNPGGYLEVAQNIAGWFLDKGDVVVIEDFGQGSQQEHKSQGNARFKEYPIVVLINSGSASGAEILAGALRDNREVQLIGEKSFGKGSVQQLEKLSTGSSLKITIARWLTPSGHLIADHGLEPDIGVELTEEDFDQGLDPQLDKALEIIREM